ncbi:MMPL family transporter [Actinomadura barringtoniae]|uniref:MMPL family transporter n=1 Tax=Actinomadura barringtoniae TaxID=1427535 RepID=UPI001FB7D2C7|nr:MMPL family transporter [Actinomadura barringtoniae]
MPSGRWAKWIILGVWIALLIPAFAFAGKLGDVEKNDMSAWLPKDAEATKVLDQAATFQPSDTMPAVVIYDRAGSVTPADLTKAKADAVAFKGVKDVEGAVQGPVPSKDGKALQTVVTIKLGSEGWAGATKAVDKMLDIAKGNSGGLGVHVTGMGGYAADSGKIFTQGNSLGLITAVVVIVILLFTYRSPLLWLLPLLTAGGALFGAEAVVYLLAKHAGLTVNAQSAFIITVLVFGAATDYALLLIARYREELRRHEDRHEAMAEALHRSGPAIVASAATVAISLMVLMLATLNSTKGLGPVCAIGILVGLLAMVTLMPALLVIFGRWIFWPKRPSYGSPEPTSDGLWTRVGARVAARPRLVWIGTAVVLAALSIGLVGMKADGIPQKDQFTKKTQAVVGEEIQAAHFPAGSGDPIYVVAKASAADQVKTTLQGVPGVVAVEQPILKNGDAFILATLKDAPNSKPAMDTVKKARTAVHGISGAEARLGGGTAITLDMENAAARDSKVIIPVVLVVVFLILALLLRAVVAPLLLMGTVVLSFGAALGVSVLMFEHVFKFGGMDASFPLMAFVFLVALGIDYNIFLVTRVREEAMLHGTRRGALAGLSATGGVITSAGLVLAGTFAALGSMPMVFAAELGFTVAFGVLLDTLIVRSVLVTALTLDVGRRMWWPSALSKPGAEPPAGEQDPELALAGK